MRSKLLTSLVAGSLIFSSSVAMAQSTGAALEPASEASLGSNGESRLDGGDVDATTAIIFGLIIFIIAIWVGRSGDDDDIGQPFSP